MDKVKKGVSVGVSLLLIIGFLFLILKLSGFAIEHTFQQVTQKYENDYKKTHVYLPAEGLIVNKKYVAQHTDYIYGLFYRSSTTSPESYTITLQRTYKGKKITGDYNATEDEYKSALVGAIYNDPLGKSMWFDLPGTAGKSSP